MFEIKCDYCESVTLRWRHGREQQPPSALDLFKEHICQKCLTARTMATRELEMWWMEQKEKNSEEYMRRYTELFEKLRGKNT